jgi:dihydroorotate dehydrogenase (fumarate)
LLTHEIIWGLLINGIDSMKSIESDILKWMEEHEYESVQQMRGSMSQAHCADPTAFERAQYMKALTSYRVPVA